MGNELCGGPDDGPSGLRQSLHEVILEGHIRNSQTRAMMAILESSKIQWSFISIDIELNQDSNILTSSIVQGQGSSQEIVNENTFKKKMIPILTHQGFKIISNLIQLIQYLQAKFPQQMIDSYMWPSLSDKKIISYLDWHYQHVRPCVKEYIAFIVAKTNAEKQNDQVSQDLEKVSQTHLRLQKATDSYLLKFKFICKEMEQKFFKEKTKFIIGQNPSCFDHVLYQELLSLMIISGEGKQSEIFSQDSGFRQEIKNLSEWYFQMSQNPNSKYCADLFQEDLKGVKNPIQQSLKIKRTSI